MVVSFDLVPEEEHPQLAVRGLVHGLGLHAHAVLVWRELVGALLLVPQVEQASRRRSDHQEVAMELLLHGGDVLLAAVDQGSGPDVQTPTPRKLLVQLQQSISLPIIA
ncbi:hypothetical protein EYF80_031100 [Liparis tanakae]|uniref:Uncharacterized protein n=1 Tax=Liparis tanakae TaxID=230148 RepID=A0A4Z2GYS7_9TELE|nr:hypothetical protein EYF80_031100 [Liparis tanakae]